MIMSNIHNRTPKNGILFTDLCTKHFCNRHDFMNHSVEICFATLVNLFRRNEDLIRIINYLSAPVPPSEHEVNEHQNQHEEHGGGHRCVHFVAHYVQEL